MAALAASEVALAMRLPVLPWRDMLPARDTLVCPLLSLDRAALPCFLRGGRLRAGREGGPLGCGLQVDGGRHAACTSERQVS